MTLEIADIEKRLQSLTEVYVIKYLPRSAYQDRIVQRLAEGLRAYAAFRETVRPAKLAHDFALVVHPSTLTQWNQDPRLVDGLAKLIQLVLSELGENLEAAPSLTLITDPLVEIDDLQVRLLKGTNVAETQDVKESDEVDESLPLKPAFLIVGGTKVFAIQAAVTNVGRRGDNHLVVDDPRISRYHAQVRYVRGRFIIFDLNSTGGTYVNGQRVNQSVLYPGDVISLSGLPIIFGQDNPPPITATGDKADTAPLVPASTDRSTAVLKTIPPESKSEN
jgi:hypothetical protein